MPEKMDSPAEKYNNPHVVKSVSELLAKIKVGKVKGSLHIALATLAVLEDIISQAENANAYELVGMLRLAGGMLRGAGAGGAANIARRVLRAVRLETRAHPDQSVEAASGDSLQKLVLASGSRRGTLASGRDLREPIRDHIAELRLELESTVSMIGQQATEHIDADSVVMCGTASPLVEHFLRRAAREVPYRLVLPEGPRVQQTHGLAARMCEAGVPVTVITNAAVFAVMARVTKVVLSAAGAYGGGAAGVPRGASSLAGAALYYSVPVLLLCPLYKLEPALAPAPRQVPLGDPSHLHSYAEDASESCRVYSPAQDLLSADNITLYITNAGGSSPSYIYRIMSELYDQADNVL